MPPAAPPPFDASDTIWIWDPVRGRIVWANEGAIAFWGERSLADLQARPLLPGDPNAQAMNALLEARAPRDRDAEADEDDREATLTFFPDGAPVRLLCRGRLRALRREDGGRWLAIHATPAPTEVDAGAAAREAALLESAETAFALIDESGASLLTNAAARRLFGLADADRSVSIFDRHLAPARARRAAAAALIRGAFAHTADLLGASGAAGRAMIVYRRLQDPETGETLLSLEAVARPGRADWARSALRDAAESGADGRIGLILLDAATLKVREANPTAARMLGAETLRRGASLRDILSDRADAVAAAAEALGEGETPAPIDLTIESSAGRGPWGRATLARSSGPGAPSLTLAILDLGPERRRLLLDDQRRRAAQAALAGLEVGFIFVDPEGMVRRADPVAAAALGLRQEETETAIESGLALPAMLAAPWGERLAARLQAAFAAETDAPGAAEPPIETVLIDVKGRRRLTRLSVSGRLAFGRRLVCIALDLRPRAAAPQEIAALASREPPSIDPRTAQAASHAFRTALTTIKGFAELARDDAAHPVHGRQRQRLNDIAETAAALTTLVDRTFTETTMESATVEGAAAPLVDLAAIAADAALRSAARHPVWRPSVADAVLAVAGRDDLDEALDILLAEAADRGPTRLTAARDSAAAGDVAAIELETAAAPADFWPPTTLRAAELLIERAGGRLEAPQSEPAAAIARLRIVFGVPD